MNIVAGGRVWIRPFEVNRITGPHEVLAVAVVDGVRWVSIESPPFKERWVSERMITKAVEPFI